jgi:hypothetical protein
VALCVVDHCGGDHCSQGVCRRRFGADGARRARGWPNEDLLGEPPASAGKTQDVWDEAPAVGPQGKVGL